MKRLINSFSQERISWYVCDVYEIYMLSYHLNYLLKPAVYGFLRPSISRKHFHTLSHSWCCMTVFVALQAIGYASMLNSRALEVMRTKCLPHLLLSDLTDDVELQSSLVACLVALASKGEEKKEDDKKKCVFAGYIERLTLLNVETKFLMFVFLCKLYNYVLL